MKLTTRQLVQIDQVLWHYYGANDRSTIVAGKIKSIVESVDTQEQEHERTTQSPEPR